MFIPKPSHGLLKVSSMKSSRTTLALHRHFLLVQPSSWVSDHAFAKMEFGSISFGFFVRFSYMSTIIANKPECNLERSVFQTVSLK